MNINCKQVFILHKMSLPSAIGSAVRTGAMSATKSGKFVFKWEIDNFSVDSRETGQALVSPTFSTDDGLEWQILLFPKGSRSELNSKECLSIYLQLINESSTTVTYSFSILNSKDEKCGFYTLSAPVVIMMRHGHGCEDIKITGGNRSLLPNSKLTILCEITTDPKMYNEKNNQCHNQNFIDFQKFLNNKEFSDVKFIVEGKHFHAHKAVLANRSEVFAAMFKHDMKEKLQNTVEIVDIEYEIFEELFRYLYRGTVSIVEKNAKKLYIAADKYGLEELKTMCTRCLCHNLSIHNALAHLDFADAYGIVKLKKQTVDFVVRNVKNIEQFKGFISITDLHKDIIVAVFHCLGSQKESEQKNKRLKLSID